MITITCDMCGEKLNTLTNRVDLIFDADDLIIPRSMGNTFRSTKKQLCVACATRLLNWIGNQLEKGSDN